MVVSDVDFSVDGRLVDFGWSFPKTVVCSVDMLVVDNTDVSNVFVFKDAVELRLDDDVDPGVSVCRTV